MNHWLILLLTIVAMWAIVLVFMWWRTTEKWDWASAELKPLRTVPQEPQLHTHPKPLQFAETGDFLDHLATVEQRVTALEEEMGTDDPTRWTLRDRIVGLEQQIGVLQRAATPSQVTENPTTGSPSDAQGQGSTLRPTHRYSPSGQPTTTGGGVVPIYESVEPTDAKT